MLEIKKLSVVSEEKQILKDLNLTMKEGEIHALMGPNGVGKSTLCKTIAAHPSYKIIKGDILWNQKSIKDLDASEISKLGIYYISQNPPAIEGVTNAEMLRIALNARTNKKIDIFAFNKKCNEVCAKINLPKSFLHRAINDGMSGGERKKNELLHLWMLEPNLILLDELDSGLDVDALKIVTESLMEYYKEKKPAMLIITHHNKILERIKPDYVHILSEGTIASSGDYSLAEKIEKEGFSNISESKN